METLTWAALIGAGTAGVAMIRFWMDMGKAHARADEAHGMATTAAAKAALAEAKIADLRVEIAQTYATNKALNDSQAALGLTVNTAVAGVNGRLDTMTARLDSLITIANRNPA